jgi:NADH dehydrogenase
VAGGLDDLELSRSEQILFTPTLQSVTDPRIFAIGNCASCPLRGSERPVPPRAQAAHQGSTRSA